MGGERERERWPYLVAAVVFGDAGDVGLIEMSWCGQRQQKQLVMTQMS